MKKLYIFILLFVTNFLFGQNDFTEIKGKVMSDKNEPVQNAELILKLSDSIIYKTLSNEKGEYIFSLKQKSGFATLTIEVSSNTKSPKKIKDNFMPSKNRYEINLLNKLFIQCDFTLTTAIVCYSMPSVLFKYNSIDFVPKVFYRNDSIKTLEAINYFHEMMLENPKMVIQLSGHTSSNEKTDSLSVNRARVVASILIKKGILKENILCIGIGNSALLATKSDLKKAKSKKGKDALHSINRYVSISIISFGNENEKTDAKNDE